MLGYPLSTLERIIADETANTDSDDADFED